MKIARFSEEKLARRALVLKVLGDRRMPKAEIIYFIYFIVNISILPGQRIERGEKEQYTGANSREDLRTLDVGG